MAPRPVVLATRSHGRSICWCPGMCTWPLCLARSIHAKSGNGVVHDAAVRDWDGIKALPGFASYVRGYHPTYASPTIMLMGINSPVRIGGVTVMPADRVL